MKTTCFSILTVLCLTTLFFINDTTFAQDSPQWHLPDGARARLGKGTIGDIAYSPDGSRLAVGGSIGIWLYDTGTLQEVALLTGNTQPVDSVAYSPDGRMVAGGSYQEVLLWDVATGSLINTLGGHAGWVNSVAFSPDSTTLASGNDGYDDYWVRLWDVATGNLINTLQHTYRVYSVAFSPDGTTLASADRDGVRLWDAATGSLINTLNTAWGYYSIAFSPDSTTLAVGHSITVYLWDVATGELIHTLDGHTWYVRSVAFSPDGTTLASGSRDNTARLWDVSTGELINTLAGHTGWVYSVAFSPDGITLTSGSGDYSEVSGGRDHVDDTVRLWDVATGSLINTIEHTGSVRSVAFSPDGITLASGSGGSTVRLWDAATGNITNTLEHTGSVRSVAFSPDGMTLASGSGDNTVRLWDIASGSLIHTLQGGGSSVAFSPDGTTLAAGSENNTVRLWDAATGSLINTLIGHTKSVLSVAFSPDGTTIASGSESGTVRLWDAATGNLINTLQGGGNSVAFSPDGTTIAAMSYSRIRLWDVATGSLTKTLQGGGSSIAFSPDGGTLASGSDDGNTVHLWDVSTGEPINTLVGHTAWVRSVAFSPDGRTLASGSADGTMLLWKITPINLSPDKITGPWLWMIAPTERGQGGAASTDVDSLAVVSSGTVTEADVATNGANDGDRVGALAWTLGEISPIDGNIDDTVAAIGLGTGATQDRSSYALITLESASAQSGVTMRVGSDDSIKVWLNGEVVHRNAINRAAYNFQDTFSVNLVQGDNLLLVKVSNRGGGSVMFVGIDANVNAVYKPPTGGELRFSPNAVADQTLVVNNPITLLYLPIATGGTAPYTYTLEPIPAGLAFDAAIQVLSGTPTTAGTTTAIYTATDTTGASAALTFTIEVTEDVPGPVPGPDPLDVNSDGQVNVLDLVQVAIFYGKRGNNLPEDVNADGVVNVTDLVAVAAGIDAADALLMKAIEQVLLLALEQAAEIAGAAGAPMGFSTHALSLNIAYDNVATALADVKHLATDDAHLGKGVETVIEELLRLLAEMRAIPETTALLPNYPNPFNPETWLPYHLAKDANVTLTIYDVRGSVVRALMLGYQSAGVYENRWRAAYWDGRNHHGEPVASGVYFYTLTAGDFTATRKMLIRK